MIFTSESWAAHGLRHLADDHQLALRSGSFGHHGPILDRYGRKWPMILGYIGNAVVYLGYLGATEYWHFALCMALTGLSGPFQRVAPAP